MCVGGIDCFANHISRCFNLSTLVSRTCLSHYVSSKLLSTTKENPMGDIASFISAVIAAICAVGSLVGWFLARKEANKAAERASKALEASERKAKALESLVVQGRDAAERAELAVSTAQEHSESALRSAEAVEAIAVAFKPAKFTMEWNSRNLFVLRNTSGAPITVTDFSDPDAFVRQPFEVPITISPNKSIQGRALSVHGREFPSELVLIIDGASSPVVVPTTGRPPF